MPSERSLFPHPLFFWFGCALITAGVLSHGPMLLMGQHTHWRLAGMPMTAGMLAGMALIPVGLALSCYGLLPPGRGKADAQATALARGFHVGGGVALSGEHWKLVVVLIVTLAVDVMKPATLGFVMPGLSAEYGLPRSEASLLALLALTGTAIGSLAWGRIADRSGRRAAILLSALMFIGTSICGAMPSFGWNLAMCFLMGASAGGLLPITFTLMAETVPARHRGWLLVMLGGIGTSAGYMIAAKAAELLEPAFSWRALWLLGLPTGAVIIFLNRFIPESPSFLAEVGRHAEASAVLRRFGAVRDATDGESMPASEAASGRVMRQLFRDAHAPITWALTVCGIGWGLVNFGFVLWLPANLTKLGVDASAVSTLLAKSALLALPGIALVILLYQRWSSVKALMLFIAATAGALLFFGVLAAGGLQSNALTMFATATLLVAVSGVIAMLIPYAAEIYPVQLRGSGSGLIAASSKLGGILAAALALASFFDHFALSAVAVAVPMLASVAMLWRHGVETRGVGLEDIQREIRARGPVTELHRPAGDGAS